MTDILRTAISADFPALRALEVRAFRGPAARHYGARAIERMLSEVTMLSPELLAEGHTLLIERDGRPVATGTWSRARPGYAAALADAALAPDTARLRSVSTDPDCLRQGLARRIVAALEADARAAGIRRLSLTATRSGIALYRALGYAAGAPVTGHLSDGTPFPCLEMWKSLRIPAAA